MWRLLSLVLALLGPALAASSVSAPPSPQPARIEFGFLEDKATVSGTLAAGASTRYVFEAGPGQRLVVRLWSRKDDGCLSVGHRSGPVAYPGAERVREWQGQPPTKGGHLITVFAGAEPLIYDVEVIRKPAAEALIFPDGTGACTASDTLNAGETARYVLDTWKGQRIRARVRAASGKARLWVEDAENERPSAGAEPVTQWEGGFRSPSYKTISVTAIEAPCAFTLEVTLGPFPNAPKSFRLTQASRLFDFEIRQENRKPGHTSFSSVGTGRVEIRKKGAKQPLQVLTLPQLELYEEDMAHNSLLQGPPTDDTTFTLVLDDFNFDGREDLALCNGHDGSYFTGSYTVFLWDPRQRRFLLNQALSRLTVKYEGLFDVDPKQRRLITHAKSGAQWRMTRTFRAAGNRPLLVAETIRDAIAGQYPYELIRTRRRVQGRWVTRTWREKSPY